MLYTYTDHLGSITHITDSEGKLLAEISYDAWGRLQDPETLQAYPAGFENPQGFALTSERGYTGHEHLTHFGIINMNGRLYDPVLGRMLSPDNYVQAPDFTQNFNRYSYVLNNPLKYNDPSGEFWFSFAVGATLGGIQGIRIARMQGYGFGNWQLYAYSVAGSVIGGFSGGMASEISSMGGFMANTIGTAAGSFMNSAGMSALSQGQTVVTMGFGIGSYNITQNEWNGIWNWGDNSTLENIGYFYGTFANISDIYAVGNSINTTMSTKYEGVGHNSLSGGNEVSYDIETQDPYYEVDISVGQGDIGNINISDKSAVFKKVATNPYWDKYLGKNDPSLKLSIPNLNKNVLKRMTENLKRYHSSDNFILADGSIGKQNWYYNLSGTGKAFFRFPGNVCTSYVSRALWRVGVPNIGIFPHMLYTSLLFRQTVLYSNSYFIGF